MKGRSGHSDARHYLRPLPPARLRFRASGRATYCLATSSAHWSPIQVAFHRSPFAGPLPSAALATDGNEDIHGKKRFISLFFMSGLTSAKQA